MTRAIAAAPGIGFPINSQVPPVARVSKDFQFIFAESTFISSSRNIVYELSGAPAWLHLDPRSRTLSGVAPAEAVGPAFLRVVASDETGSTAMEVTLMVSAEPGPGLGTPVVDQLAAQGAFSAPDSFMIARSGPFSLSFSKSTFTNTNEKTVYYAICANNTPLPSWINFNPNALLLTGIAPQSTSPSELPQSYGIQLIASDVVGFSGAIAKFQIMVGGHVFAFGKSLEVINALQGLSFNFSGLGAALVLDGRPVNPTDIGQVVADTPEWMSLDKGTLMVSGTPPPFETSRNVTITATDVYGDTASTKLLVQVSNNSSSLFRGSIGILNATAGSEFVYTIDRSILASPDVEVAVDVGENFDWLKFDASTLRLYGRVPKDIDAQKALLNITARLRSQTESRVITIGIGRDLEGSGEGSDKLNKSTSTSTGASPSSTKKGENSSATSAATPKSKRKWLPAVILLPIAVALAALIFICIYKRKRRQRSFDDSEKPEKDEISRPMEQDTSWLTIREDEAVEQPRRTQKRESSKPPKLEIKDLWSSSPIRRGSRSRWSRMADEEDNLSQTANVFREFVGRNFNAVRPEPAAVQAFNRQAEQYSLSRPQTRCRSARSRQSATSAYSSFSEVIPSCTYSRPGKPDLRMSLLSSKLMSSQRVSGLGRADISMGHGMEIIEKGGAHRRTASDMALYSRLSRAGFGSFSGPPAFGLVRATWRNPGARSNETSEYATTDSSSRHHDAKPSEVSLMMQAFPQTPTFNTLQMCSPVAVKGSHEMGKAHQPATVRMVAPSPTSSLRYQPTLQHFHRQRISSRQRLNPFLSAGPTSRASSSSLLKVSRKSTQLSRNQSVNSLTSETQGLDSPSQQRRQSRLDKSGESPSRASFPSSSQSPHRRYRPPQRRHRLSTFGQFLHTRHRSSISATSSKRFMTPDPSDRGEEEERDDVGSESFYDAGHDDIEEDIDEEGQRLWRPVESYDAATAAQYGTGHPFMGSDIFSPRWSSSGLDAGGDDGSGDMTGREYQKPHIDSSQHAETNIDETVERDADTTNNPISKHLRPESRKRLLVVGGARGKRPVSVDVQTGLGKGWSLRGDMREDSKEGSVFL